jgi:hypothetical protein
MIQPLETQQPSDLELTALALETPAAVEGFMNQN